MARYRPTGLRASLSCTNQTVPASILRRPRARARRHVPLQRCPRPNATHLFDDSSPARPSFISVGASPESNDGRDEGDGTCLSLGWMRGPKRLCCRPSDGLTAPSIHTDVAPYVGTVRVQRYRVYDAITITLSSVVLVFVLVPSVRVGQRRVRQPSSRYSCLRHGSTWRRRGTYPAA